MTLLKIIYYKEEGIAIKYLLLICDVFHLNVFLLEDHMVPLSNISKLICFFYY